MLTEGGPWIAFKPGDLPKLGTDQTFSLFFDKYEVITDFKPGTDKIDLPAIDATGAREHTVSVPFVHGWNSPQIRVFAMGKSGYTGSWMTT